jgi:hypothetical protein
MKGSDIPDLTKEGIEVRTDASPYALMHNKFVIIDDQILMTGSYNWTSQATKFNQENLIVLENEELCRKFIEEFDVLWKKFSPQNLQDTYKKETKKTQLYLKYINNQKVLEEKKKNAGIGSPKHSLLSPGKKISKFKKFVPAPVLPKPMRPNEQEVVEQVQQHKEKSWKEVLINF